MPPGEPVTSGLGVEVGRAVAGGAGEARARREQPGRRRWCTEGRRFWGVWGQREVPLESRTWGRGWRASSREGGLCPALLSEPPPCGPAWPCRWPVLGPKASFRPASSCPGGSCAQGLGKGRRPR